MILEVNKRWTFDYLCRFADLATRFSNMPTDEAVEVAWDLYGNHPDDVVEMLNAGRKYGKLHVRELARLFGESGVIDPLSNVLDLQAWSKSIATAVIKLIDKIDRPKDPEFPQLVSKMPQIGAYPMNSTPAKADYLSFRGETYLIFRGKAHVFIVGGAPLLHESKSAINGEPVDYVVSVDGASQGWKQELSGIIQRKWQEGLVLFRRPAEQIDKNRE